VLVSDFDYFLSAELIAQQPLPDRAASRMLHLIRDAAPADADLTDRLFREFPDLLRPDDLLVFNNSRVFPARLFGRRAGIHSQPVSPRNPASRDFLQGRVEVLLTRQTAPEIWECLVHPGKKIGVGERLCFGDELQADVVARSGFGERTLRFEPVADFFAALERIGHVPLPPYIDRADHAFDRERYQTVYARERGSVAAPTAGLHFTPDTLQRLRRRGVETAEVTLHVGLGTFQPAREANVEDNRLHVETYCISAESAERINGAAAAGRRVVAVGTTTVRTLEDSSARCGPGRVAAGTGDTRLFIYPGYKFQLVNALLTNFHLPKSTLLMLVCAFAGRERVLAAYAHAVRQRYRFYSYGDCMFVE
jgi:S-adenosylmethionine:tRNA ribosyltransferase-isomerase